MPILVTVWGAPLVIDRDRLCATLETFDTREPERPSAIWTVLYSTTGHTTANHIGGSRVVSGEEEDAARFALLARLAQLGAGGLADGLIVTDGRRKQRAIARSRRQPTG